MKNKHSSLFFKIKFSFLKKQFLNFLSQNFPNPKNKIKKAKKT